MQTEDALYHLVYDYPGGADALAPRMGLAPQTLRNMANPCQETHGWSLKRIRQAVALSGDTRPLEALASEFGGIFASLSAFDGMPEQRLLRAMTKMAREFGDVPRVLGNALKDDGRISPRELSAIRTQIAELQQAAGVLGKIAERICEERKVLDQSERPE